MAEMNSIGVGLIGTGFMGKSHALAYNSVKPIFGDVPQPRRLLLVDLDAKVARQRAEEFGFARSSTDWKDLISDPDIKLVSIASWNGSHREISEAALAAGKHVWCEKPMALTLKDAEAMGAAARKAKGCIAMLGYNYVKNPAVQTVKKIIADGLIGEVIDFRGTVDEDYMADPQLPWSWRLKAADAGLGTVGDITCHLISLTLDCVGPIDSVTAIVETVHKERPLPDQPGKTGTVENDDVAHAVIRLRNGARGTIASSRVAHGRKNVLRIEVHGTKGMVIFDQERMNEVQLYTADGAKETRGFRTILTGPQHPPYGLFCPAPGHQLGFNDLKAIELAHLLRAIEGKVAPYLSFEDGLRIERTIDAMVRSSKSGRWETVAAG
jgi:predicted dehydrogenase